MENWPEWSRGGMPFESFGGEVITDDFRKP